MVKPKPRGPKGLLRGPSSPVLVKPKPRGPQAFYAVWTLAIAKVQSCSSPPVRVKTKNQSASRRISGLPCLHDRLECVTELRASDGTTLGTFNVGHTPFDILFDGTNIWTSNESGGSNDSSLTKLRASDGALLGTFPMDGPRGLAFDGQSIWVANNSDQTVTKFRPSDGAIELVVPVRTYPSASVLMVAVSGCVSPVTLAPGRELPRY
jgi:outer membrane protein assembly factor BamB